MLLIWLCCWHTDYHYGGCSCLTEPSHIVNTLYFWWLDNSYFPVTMITTVAKHHVYYHNFNFNRTTHIWYFLAAGLLYYNYNTPSGQTWWIDMKLMSTVDVNLTINLRSKMKVFVTSIVDIKLRLTVAINLMSHIDTYLTIQLDVNFKLPNLMYVHEINTKKIIFICISIHNDLLH